MLRNVHFRSFCSAKRVVCVGVVLIVTIVLSVEPVRLVIAQGAGGSGPTAPVTEQCNPASCDSNCRCGTCYYDIYTDPLTLLKWADCVRCDAGSNDTYKCCRRSNAPQAEVCNIIIAPTHEINCSSCGYWRFGPIDGEGPHSCQCTDITDLNYFTWAPPNWYQKCI
jgi:hypothetical protein